MEFLELLLQKRNNLYIKWLGTSNALDHHMFVEARRKARLAARTAKNKWFVAKAEEAQKRRGRSGLAAIKTAIVADDDCVPCVTTSKQEQQWRHHCTIVLNAISTFDTAGLEKIEQRSYPSEFDDMPSS